MVQVVVDRYAVERWDKRTRQLGGPITSARLIKLQNHFERWLSPTEERKEIHFSRNFSNNIRIKQHSTENAYVNSSKL